MSLLSDRDIAREFERGSLGITGWHPDGPESWRLQPASFELTLNGEVNSLLGYSLDPWQTAYVSGRRFGKGDVGPKIVHHAIIDPEDPPPLVVKPWWISEKDQRRSYMLQPGEFLLGSTTEHVSLGAGLYGAVEGKSSLGRMGLMIHITAGHIDPGWSGQITLEFFNAAPRPIRLWAGMRVAQLLVGRMSSPSERSYGDESLGSHYQASLSTVQAASVKHVEPEVPFGQFDPATGRVNLKGAVPAGPDRFA